MDGCVTLKISHVRSPVTHRIGKLRIFIQQTQAAIIPTQHLLEFLISKLWSSCLGNKHFTHQAIFPATDTTGYHWLMEACSAQPSQGCHQSVTWDSQVLPHVGKIYGQVGEWGLWVPVKSRGG